MKKIVLLLILIFTISFVSASDNLRLSNPCDINYFEINPVSVDQNLIINFSCNENVEINLLFFTSTGDNLLGPVSLPCLPSITKYDQFVPTQDIVHGVRIYSDECNFDKYFNPSRNISVAIPDNNFLVVLVLLVVVIFLINKRER